MQAEYATDLVFRSAATLGPLYEQLTRASVLSVKAEQIATFLGRKITPQLAQEVGSQFSTRIEGTCIKHHRKVEHRDGRRPGTSRPVKKTIYSLIDLREILFGCNRRYLEHLSALDDFSAGVRALDRVTKPRVVGDKTVKGINFFAAEDSALLHALQDPRVNIAGIRRGDLLARTWHVLAKPPVEAVAPVAGSRRGQAGQGNVSILPDKGWTGCNRCGGKA